MIFTGRYEALSTPFLKEKEHGKCQNKQKEFLVERSWLFCKRFLEVSVHAIFLSYQAEVEQIACSCI